MTSLDSKPIFNSEIDPLLGNLATDAQEIAAQLLDTMFPHSPHKRPFFSSTNESPSQAMQ
jgi:hypothetical protein